MGIVAHCEIQEKHLDRNDSFKAFRFSLAVAAYSPKRVHVFGLKSSVSEGKSARFTFSNERDFPVPSKPRARRVAVYGNSVPRWRGQTFHQLVLRGEAHVYRSGWN